MTASTIPLVMLNRGRNHSANPTPARSKNASRILRSNAEAAADVNKELAEIGLSDKAGWYASAVLYGAGSIVTLALGLIDRDLFPNGIMTLAMIAFVIAGLSLVGARYLVNADWATHMRLGGGLMILGTGAFIAGPLGPAFIMLPMFTIFTPCYLYGSRFALPYTVMVIALSTVVVALETDRNTLAHTVISIGSQAMIIAGFMISEQRTRTLAKINRRLAYTDSLTQIANTRKLREELTDALARSSGDAGKSFALFAMDLDNFKLVNDLYDHTMGDDVLKAVAEELDSELDADDLVARRGGDEFSVLVTEIENRDLDELTERLTAAIARARTRVCPSVTPSGSVAYVRSQPADTLALILQRADDELHDAKEAFHSRDGSREDVAAKVAEVTARHLHSVPDVGATNDDDRESVVARIAAVLREVVVDVNPVWGFASVTIGSISAVGAVLAAAGQLRPLDPAEGTAIGLVGIMLAMLAFLAGRKKLSLKLLHPLFVFGIGIYALAIALAGPAGEALLDGMAVVMLSAFFWFRPKAAFAYAGAIGTIGGVLAVAGSFPNAIVRIAITNTVILVAAALVVKVRGITVQFARTNRELSEIDALTGVANLRALRLRAVRAIERAGPRTPAMISVDLDKFKDVNDTYNHTTGDQVIVAVARAVSETVRTEDLVARRGGDEFFVLCMANGEDEIDALCSRLSEAVIHARLRICPDLMPTASITAIFWREGEQPDQFLARADAALHDEKSAKRDRDYDRATA